MTPRLEGSRPLPGSPRPGGGLVLALLAAVFVLVPIAEVALLVQAGRTIGVGATVAILVVEAIFGAWLMKREGSRAWAALNGALSRGTMPSRQLADAALVLVGGALFLLPGFVTDLFGLVCLLPFTRGLPRRLIAWIAGRQARRHGLLVQTSGARRTRLDVIPGEVVPGSTHDGSVSGSSATPSSPQSPLEGRVLGP